LRVFLFSLAGLPLLFLDGVLIYGFPENAASLYSREEGWIALGGSATYMIAHFIIRKPERLYLWAHEFSHLIAAKLFLRKVHSFHITSRDGGKVVLDRTNVLIDLAPYIFPLYCIVAALAAVLFRSASPWVPDVYMALGSFLFTMHLFFSTEGFIKGQPDVKRSGRIFSVAVVLLCLLAWIPVLLAPGTAAGWKGAVSAYKGWLSATGENARRLFLYARSVLQS
jgi:hypothetical protein